MTEVTHTADTSCIIEMPKYNFAVRSTFIRFLLTELAQNTLQVINNKYHVK